MFRHEARVSLAPEAAAQIEISVETSEPVLLHWGVARTKGAAWNRPPESVWPDGTKSVGKGAVQSPLGSDGKWVIRVTSDIGANGLSYVFYFPGTSRWENDKGHDYWVAFGLPPQPLTLRGIIERIVEAELGGPWWTLMHRYKLCVELVGEVGGDPEGLALLFVWLRFSAIRQLTWQRNYNTQPRLLTEAQDRLTRSLAAVWRAYPDARPWVRWLLTTVGRGGEGQRIRDEILGIMHRNHIGEQSGHFLEQWHQKLHNNATPDDVAIARAYLEFLRRDGDLGAFDRELGRHGVTRERLASYDRPITTDPEFHPHAKEALIGEFSAYLRLLESIHASADLASSFDAARPVLGQELEAIVRECLARRGSFELGVSAQEAPGIVGLSARARRLLNARLEQIGDDGQLRDLLYLDEALLDQMRGAVERIQAGDLEFAQASPCLADVLDHVRLSHPSGELDILAHHLRRLSESAPASTRDLALHLRALTERIERIIGTSLENLTLALQPKAEELGKALQVAHWATVGFSEAVVRGSSFFALARLANLLEPLLRERAELGAWQVICPGAALGRVQQVDDLLAVQAMSYDSPVVLLCSRIRGEEEIPSGVVALLSQDSPDLVSHIAVRARNQHVLFAACYDRSRLDELRQETGKLVDIETTPAGEVVWRPASAAPIAPAPRAASLSVRQVRAVGRWCVQEQDYSPDIVGNKSRNLSELRRRLPDVEIPRSFALPFGSCERVLDDAGNRAHRERYRALLTTPEQHLGELRATLEALAAPAELSREFGEAAEQAGLAGIETWEFCFTAIKRVWASKWNDRAFYARRNAALEDAQLVMAVLVQPIVEAQYAFVLHTVDPATGDPNDLFGEIVWGLGETLVGNDPGSGLSFVAPRSGAPVIRGYPSKSVALRSVGLIFRSDSNGEDLQGYSGAGLYESVTAREGRRELIDYTEDRLLWDGPYREQLLVKLADFGRRIEAELGGAQDIEGAILNERIILLQARPQVGLK